MTQAIDTIHAYFDILASKHGEGLANIITDDVTFEGPFFKATGAAEFLGGMDKWLQVPKVYHLQRLFVDGNDTCSIYTIDLTAPSGEKVTVDMADWIELKDGKVHKERVYFDPREWAKALAQTKS